ncbi:unnamed protein product [Orchesella dallaii]|uniref:Uncharacterized protein n=1 Tax=Orchesella dallaii TaxID=48710 RepID=A0ABP1QQC9_9HEXA
MQEEHDTIWDCNRDLYDLGISLETLYDAIHSEINWENLQTFFELAKDLSEFSSLYNPLIKHIKELCHQNAVNFLDMLHDFFKKFEEDCLQLIDAHAEAIANGNQNQLIEIRRTSYKIKTVSENLKTEFEAKKLDVNKVINQCLGMVEEIVNTKCVINSMRNIDILMVMMRKERIAFLNRLVEYTRLAYYSLKLVTFHRPHMHRRLQRPYAPIKNQFQILTRKDEVRNFESELDNLTEKIEKFTSEWIEPLLQSYGEVGEMGKEKALKNLKNAMEAADTLDTAVRKIKAEWDAVKDNWCKKLGRCIVKGTKFCNGLLVSQGITPMNT